MVHILLLRTIKRSHDTIVWTNSTGLKGFSYVLLYLTRLALVLVLAVRGRISKFRAVGAVRDRPSRVWQEWKQNIFLQITFCNSPPLFIRASYSPEFVHGTVKTATLNPSFWCMQALWCIISTHKQCLFVAGTNNGLKVLTPNPKCSWTFVRILVSWRQVR